MKRVLSFLCVIAMVFALCIPAFAVTLDYQNAEIKTGSLHDLENTDYKFSWLNKLIIRDDATAVTTCRLVPHASYPYSRTYDEFLTDVKDIMGMADLDESSVEDSLNSAVDLIYYSAVAMGLTADQDTMLSYLQKKGIRIPVNMSSEDKVEAGVVYAAEKYNLTYALFDKETEFTEGRTIEGATVDILATATGITIPSGVDTIQGLALYCCEAYAQSFEDLPISDNPSEEEIFYFVKLVTSAEQGYSVPEVAYDTLTDVQEEYVDCTYYASLFDTVYDIHMNALELAEVAQDNDVAEIARLVLETMLDSKEITYDADEDLETLFNLCCKNGFFDMDEDFYSDVFNYDLYVSNDCEKLWFTPFSIASQLGGDDKNLTVKIGDKEISAGSTTYYPLDLKKDTQNVVVTATYDDGEGNSDMTIYVFNVIREDADEQTASTSLGGKIESMLDDVVPEESEKGQKIVSQVVSAADSAASGAADALTPDTEDTKSTDEETTADSEDAVTTYAADEKESTTLADYLGDLTTYGDDENKSTSQYDKAEAVTTTKSNIITNAVNTVKESPEVIAVPSGVVAAGALAGYLFTKRKKSPDDVVEDDEKPENKD